MYSRFGPSVQTLTLSFTISVLPNCGGITHCCEVHFQIQLLTTGSTSKNVFFVVQLMATG